jgi:hypothetical protein
VSFSINLGSGDYYQPVGDYDYLPYAYQTNPGYAAPRINFHDMMGQYGVWVNVSPFGHVWKPYASNDWRPYTYGHWISTQQYGQMWEGYEPWAWAGYHYGNWIFDRNYGWVWIPGYDWHAGRVTWARSYDSIGWMPAPPYGYDYSRGYLSNVGPYNQFTYNDNDFGAEFGTDNYSYGGPYYDPRYQNMYYNPSYNAININLWIFIDNSHYGYDNYANYALGPDYTRHIFDRRLVRITNHPIDRIVLERVIRQRVQETPVEVRQLQTDRQTIRVVVPTSTDAVDKVRKESKEVVRQIIAPGFAEKQQAFKGQNSKNKDVVSRIFHQENVQPKVETLSSEQIINQAREASQKREQSRKQIEQAQNEKLIAIEKAGKIKEPKKEKIEPETDLNGGSPESGSELQKQNEVQKQSDAVKQRRQHEAELQSDAAKQKVRDVQKQKDAITQKEHEVQAQNEATKNKQQEEQQQIDSAQKKAQEKDSVEQAQTEPTKESDKSQQDSKDKKAKSKTKHKEKPKPQQEEQPPQ